MQDNVSSEMEQQPKPMTGLEALRRALQMQDGYEALTLKLLHLGQLGVTSPSRFRGAWEEPSTPY